MYFDRFDIVSAHYAFWSDHSADRLSRIRQWVRLGPLFRGFSSLSENGRAIYLNLVDLHTPEDRRLLGTM